MSGPRSVECLFCVFKRASRPRISPAVRRKFHASVIQRASQPDSAPDIDLEEAAERFRKEAKDNGALKEYSAQQQAAIKIAQKMIDPEVLKKDTGMRTDPWKMKYYDDLTKISPVVDKAIKAPWTNLDDNSRLKTEEEITQDFVDLMHKLPDNVQPEHLNESIWDDFDKKLRLTVGREEAERNPRTALVPDLPSLSPKPQSKKSKRSRDGEGEDKEEAPSPALLRLMQMTGFTRRQIASLRVKSVVVRRVSNQTRLGKIHKTYFLSVAGNGQGLVGIGEGKSEEPSEALVQSQYRAIRNMQPILRYERRTIYGDVNAKVSATELELYSRPPGFGLRCQRDIWEVCKAAGITDLAAKITRTRNPMNIVKATVKALQSQKHPEDVARGRGKKLVDVRKVYYAGEI